MPREQKWHYFKNFFINSKCNKRLVAVCGPQTVAFSLRFWLKSIWKWLSFSHHGQTDFGQILKNPYFRAGWAFQLHQYSILKNPTVAKFVLLRTYYTLSFLSAVPSMILKSFKGCNVIWREWSEPKCFISSEWRLHENWRNLEKKVCCTRPAWFEPQTICVWRKCSMI